MRACAPQAQSGGEDPERPERAPGGGPARREVLMADMQVVHGKMEFAGLTGPIWLTGWMFTIGFAGLPTTKAIFALAIWPYYLGAILR